MYDITFVDVPNLQINSSDELSDVLNQYYASCNKIIQKVTGYEVIDKPFNYTLGLLCLGRYIKEFNYTVGYINMNTDQNNFENIVKQSKIVCFSTMTITINYVIKLAIAAKMINNKIKIIFGGYHASYAIQELFEKCGCLDIIVIGEGEHQYINILKGVPIKEIRGVAYCQNNKVIINELEEPLLDDEIPSPDFTLLSNRLELYNIHMSTMRGCIGRCLFCVNKDYWGKPRLVSLNKIEKELVYLKNNLPDGTLIHFSDNVFTYNKNRVKKLNEIINKVGYKFVYECDTLSSLIDEEVVSLLSKMKIIKIHLGVEDCVDDILRIANKSVNYRQNLQAMETIRLVSNKICIYAYWLIGLPGTNRNTIKKNRIEMQRLLKENKVDIISPKVFIPYPGTDFFREPQKYEINILSYDWDTYERRTPPFPYKLRDFGGEEMYQELLYVMHMCEELYKKKLQ